MIRALAAAGGKLDAVNKDNLTPLLLAEKPKKPNPADMGDLDVYKPKRDSKEEVIAALRELMHLGPNDPAPQPPPLSSRQERRRTIRINDKEARKTVPKAVAAAATMKVAKSMARKIVITAALACFGIAALLVAQTTAALRRRQPTSTAAPSNRGGGQVPRFVDKYCVACHNKRTAFPADGSGQSRDGGLRRSVGPRGDLGESPSEAERAGDAASRHRRVRPKPSTRALRAGWLHRSIVPGKAGAPRAATSCIV